MKGKQSFKNTEGKCSLRYADDWNSWLLFLSEFDHNRSRWLEKKKEKLIIRGSSRYTEAEEMVCQPIKWWKIFRNDSQLQTLQQGSVSPSRALSFSRMRTKTITGLFLKIGSIFNCVYAFVSVWRCGGMIIYFLESGFIGCCELPYVDSRSLTWTSGRAVNSLNCWSISPCPGEIFNMTYRIKIRLERQKIWINIVLKNYSGGEAQNQNHICYAVRCLNVVSAMVWIQRSLYASCVKNMVVNWWAPGKLLDCEGSDCISGLIDSETE